MIDDQKMDTPGKQLEHHGVKGMKWGKSKAGGSASTGKPSNDEIFAARTRLASQQHLLNTQIAKTNVAAPGKAQANEAKKLAMQLDAHAKNPDHVTARHTTKGEKAAILLATGPVGAVSLAANRRKRQQIAAEQARNKK